MRPLIATRGALTALIAFAFVATAPHARAATFIVNNTSDPTVGTCDLAGACTLRQAIIEAVASTERDTIHFDPAVFPPGEPATIYVESPLPVIADPAGTVIDGHGAGVDIRSMIPVDEDHPASGLVFASARGVALANVALANLRVSGFDGYGVLICGGLPPECDADVTAPSVRHVVTIGNGDSGIGILGRNVGKPRVADSVAIANGFAGIVYVGSTSVAGARIERCTARDNEFIGFLVGFFAQSVSDTLITDSVAARNGIGLAVAGGGIAKTKLTNLALADNVFSGIAFETSGDVTATSIANVVSSGNGYGGIEIIANTITGTVVKDVAANGNKTGINLNAAIELVGTKITQTAAIGNEMVGISVGEHSRAAKIGPVAVVGNGTHGLVVRGTGNVVKQVRAAENDGDGIRLDAPGSGNRVEKCSSTANQGPGISVQTGSTANTIQKNVALGNDAMDVYDANPNCDANAWTRNVFELRNEPCIR